MLTGNFQAAAGRAQDQGLFRVTITYFGSVLTLLSVIEKLIIKILLGIIHVAKFSF